MKYINWQGVHPAVTTQYFDDMSINFAATKNMVESLMFGCTGWVSGLTHVFPQESVAIYKLAQQGRYKEALEIWRWFYHYCV